MPESYKIWGPMAKYGLLVALLCFGIDQAFKAWMLHVFHIGARQPVSVLPYFDLVLAWNKGISYGWLKGLGPWLLIVGQSLATLFLWLWMAGSKNKGSALILGLIIGGAWGNIADRLHYGAVADFFYLHGGGFSWYVFNLADVAIVVGAALLLYDFFKGVWGKPGQDDIP